MFSPSFIKTKSEPMSKRISQSDLESYLDEALPADEMAAIEAEVRKHPELLSQMSAINSRRDAGLHSVGEIWRRNRLSCPSREDLGSYLLGVLSPEQMDYIKFHLETIGCRFCAANQADLARQQAEGNETQTKRRRKYFQTSAGYLRKPTR